MMAGVAIVLASGAAALASSPTATAAIAHSPTSSNAVDASAPADIVGMTPVAQQMATGWSAPTAGYLPRMGRPFKDRCRDLVSMCRISSG